MRGGGTSPQTQVMWKSERPDLTIAWVRGGTVSNCYHEHFFEVVSKDELDAEDFKRLDACGFLGFGQAFSVQSTEKFEEQVSARTFTKDGTPTGAPPVNAFGEAITNTVTKAFWRYLVKRICDSGD